MNILYISSEQYPIPPRRYGGIERHDYHHVLGLRSIGHKVYVMCHPHSKIDGSVGHRSTYINSQYDVIIVSKYREFRKYESELLAVDCPVLVIVTEPVAIERDYTLYTNVIPIAMNEYVHGRVEGSVLLRPFYFDIKDYKCRESVCNYHSWVGRFCSDKRPDIAVSVFQKLRHERLVMAGPMLDESYVSQLLVNAQSHANVNYIGSVTEKQKCSLIGLSNSLIYTVDENYPECFGLVLLDLC